MTFLGKLEAATLIAACGLSLTQAVSASANVEKTSGDAVLDAADTKQEQQVFDHAWELELQAGPAAQDPKKHLCGTKEGQKCLVTALYARQEGGMRIEGSTDCKPYSVKERCVSNKGYNTYRMCGCKNSPGKDGGFTRFYSVRKNEDFTAKILAAAKNNDPPTLDKSPCALYLKTDRKDCGGDTEYKYPIPMNSLKAPVQQEMEDGKKVNTYCVKITDQTFEVGNANRGEDRWCWMVPRVEDQGMCDDTSVYPACPDIGAEGDTKFKQALKKGFQKKIAAKKM